MKTLLGFLMVVLMVGCGSAPHLDQLVPTGFSSTNDPAPAPQPIPSPSPSPSPTPSVPLAGAYQYGYSSCNGAITWPNVNDAKTVLNIAESGLVSMETWSVNCNALKVTSQYSSTHTDSTLTTTTFKLYTYTAPGTCATPAVYDQASGMFVVNTETFEIVLTDDFIILVSPAVCDGFGNHMRSVYNRISYGAHFE